ncbi:hypothetical protein CRX59_19260 [Burkholderia thailandensis]|nr:hypothetical protein CRX59_19260 [Burkholderia thailandensis]PNE82867.1 hypothetical protein A8H34_00835 [Burkholderia thailandensis]PNE89155.1 hypothetical protein A8H30_02600 [Burkholderia thailandensis]
MSALGGRLPTRARRVPSARRREPRRTRKIGRDRGRPPAAGRRAWMCIRHGRRRVAHRRDRRRACEARGTDAIDRSLHAGGGTAAHSTTAAATPANARAATPTEKYR